MGYEDMIDKKRVLAEFLELIAIPCSTHDERQIGDLLTKRLQELGGTVREEKAAASPEPEMTAMKNGPNVPAAAAAACEPSMRSVNAPVRPMAVMPVVKTLAQTMRPMTSA